MGAAAEHRGNVLIRSQLSDSARPDEFRLMDELNALEKHPDAGVPFGSIVFACDGKYWWALDHEKLWDGFGFWYKTLREAVRRWDVSIVDYRDGRWMATVNSH